MNNFPVYSAKSHANSRLSQYEYVRSLPDCDKTLIILIKISSSSIINLINYFNVASS
jgi:hypothetical protein